VILEHHWLFGHLLAVKHQVAERTKIQGQFPALQAERDLELAHAGFELHEGQPKSFDLVGAQQAAFDAPRGLPLEELAQQLDNAQYKARQIALDPLRIGHDALRHFPEGFALGDGKPVEDGLITFGRRWVAVTELSLGVLLTRSPRHNTAAGDANGAEALSGLARAFFYAGARALLVSHWSVYSDATVKLITGAISTMATDKTIGRAEAMRHLMLTLIDKGAPNEARRGAGTAVKI